MNKRNKNIRNKKASEKLKTLTTALVVLGIFSLLTTSVILAAHPQNILSEDKTFIQNHGHGPTENIPPVLDSLNAWHQSGEQGEGERGRSIIKIQMSGHDPDGMQIKFAYKVNDEGYWTESYWQPSPSTYLTQREVYNSGSYKIEAWVIDVDGAESLPHGVVYVTV